MILLRFLQCFKFTARYVAMNDTLWELVKYQFINNTHEARIGHKIDKLMASTKESKAE